MSAPFVSNSFSTPSPAIATHTIIPVTNNSNISSDVQNENFPLVSTKIAPIPVSMQFSDSTPDIKSQTASPDLQYAYLYEEIAKQQVLVKSYIPLKPTENANNENNKNTVKYKNNNYTNYMNLFFLLIFIIILYNLL